MGRRDAEPTVKRDAVKEGDPTATTPVASPPSEPSEPDRTPQHGDTTAPESEGRPAIETLGDLGRYQLLFKLARGGMGTVHVGRLRSAHRFDRFVAIKKLSTPSATDEDVHAFLAEARVSAMINHPNVVQTLDVGEHQGVPFLVMPLVEGVALDRLLRRIDRHGSRLDPRIAAWIIGQTAQGLHAAHELCGVEGEAYGLVHRDVSPENVLLSFDGRVYVADFGVARFADPDRRTQSGVVKGKFAYMSPEQTEAEKLDRRSDVFSLGIVLHECLTGRRLFEGRSVADTIRRIWSVEPSDPREGRPDMPAALGPIVRRCLRRERDLRYATAGDVADDLRDVLRQEGAVIDESDIVRLLREHFPRDREKLREKIREAVRAADEGRLHERLSIEEGAEDRDSSVSEGSLVGPLEPATGATGSMTTGPPLDTRRSSTLWLVAAAAVLVGGGAWLLRGPTAQEPAHDAAPATEPSPKPDNAAPAKTAAPPLPPRSAASTSASAAVPRPMPRSAPVRPVPPAPPAPAPTGKSHKGVPFKSID